MIPQPLPMHGVIDADARPFRNYFGWSYNGQKLFNDCPRKWYLRKVVFWKGWTKKASPTAKKAYRLGKMETIATICGRVLHEAAAWRLSDPAVACRKRAIRRLNQVVRDAIAAAKAEKWRIDPKAFPPLEEYYYIGFRGEEPATRGPRIMQHAYRAMGVLFNQDPEDLALLLPPESKAMLIDHRGVPVWVQLDLAYHEDDQVRLRDWKMGRYREEHETQAAIQRVVAESIWRKRAAVELDYLGSGERRVVPRDEEQVEAVARLIVEAAEDIRQRLYDPEINGGDVSNFPTTTDATQCRDCEMLHLCQGTKNRVDADPANARTFGDPPRQRRLA